jgi:hypothetical protein
MTPTETVKQYGETAVKLTKTQLLATIGAGDLAVERAKNAVGQLRTLPGEAKVQADLGVKEARTRATEAAGQARTAAQQFRTSVRPEAVRSTSGRTAVANCCATVRALPAASVARVRASLTARSVWTCASPGRASAFWRNCETTILARSTARSPAPRAARFRVL